MTHRHDHIGGGFSIRDGDVRKKPWITPVLRQEGSLADVLRSGGGKLSVSGGDPGEMRCEKPHASQCR